MYADNSKIVIKVGNFSWSEELVTIIRSLWQSKLRWRYNNTKVGWKVTGWIKKTVFYTTGNNLQLVYEIFRNGARIYWCCFYNTICWTIFEVMKPFGRSSVREKLVPKLLNFDQENCSLSIASAIKWRQDICSNGS